VDQNVIFTGEARWDDVPRYLQLADIFVAPSVHDEHGNVDGLPTAIIEAMAAGKPIVASDVAGIPLVVSNEKTGLLVEEANPQQLSAAITRLLDEPALGARFGQAGQDRVRAELNWHQVGKKFSAIYSQDPNVTEQKGTRGAQSHLRQNASTVEDPRYAPRSRQANKILAILKDFLGQDLSNLKCLDIGCGTGAISKQLAEEFGQLVGVDIDLESAGTDYTSAGGNGMFAVADGGRVPAPDGSFDIVICAQVYEHASDQRALATEIWRVLRSGGICFFSGPNRLAVMEEHYWLPLLSWLPRPIADGYVRLLGRGKRYDVNALFYWQLRELWQPFIIFDYTAELIQNPQRFGMAEKLGSLGWISQLPRVLVKMLIPFVPNYNWILMKHDAVV
jgi:2-polyprenyl-3-methyl-5-hydroxy-6-metoxy-1,4-benzoquinol methylase